MKRNAWRVMIAAIVIMGGVIVGVAAPTGAASTPASAPPITTGCGGDCVWHGP